MLGIPGLGPKRAHQVHVELGISSMPELLAALHDGRLRDLKGWGETSERNLARAIQRMQEVGGRMPLAVALDIAEDPVAQLGALPQVSRVDYAGSLRRIRDTVGDIDLLVAADEDPDSVMDSFCTMPLVDRVLAHGSTKSSVVTTKGIQVDLRVVPAAVWGAALQYFTGSKAHNIRIRELAVRAGLTLSEYGLFRVDDNELLASSDEAEVYAKLGLPWIPPTLREDRGEVAALDGHLPDLVEVAEIVGDLHMHTDLTDGLADLDDMVAAASRHGYRYCAITDHAPLLAMQRMTRDKALRQRSELAEAARRHGIAVLHGSELNIAADGSLDWDDDFLAGFDVLVASVHSDFDQTREEMTRRLLTAIEHPYVNIIGHPTTRVLGRRPPIDFDVDAVFAAAARSHTALEINAFPDRLDLNDELVRRAREHGVAFAIDTDASLTRATARVAVGRGSHLEADPGPWPSAQAAGGAAGRQSSPRPPCRRRGGRCSPHRQSAQRRPPRCISRERPRGPSLRRRCP